jgi:hypothetical protein
VVKLCHKSLSKQTIPALFLLSFAKFLSFIIRVGPCSVCYVAVSVVLLGGWSD